MYVLRCEDNSLYTGITTDVTRRLNEHGNQSSKAAKYTRSHPPVCTECIWMTDDRQSALRLEYQIKTLTKAKKEQLILNPALLTSYFGDKIKADRYRVYRKQL